MSLQQFVRDESLWSVALRIHKRDVVIDIADALQLIRMAVMMWTSINTDQENSDMRPGQTEQIELKLIHVCCFTVQQ